MKIIVNGKETDIQEGATLRQMLESMNIAPELVACEMNQQIVRRKDYAGTALSAGDRVEIIQMIGGG